MRLLAIRDINESDPLPGLGDLVKREPAKSEPPATPALPQPTEADRDMVNRDEPKTIGGVPVWPFPHVPKPAPGTQATTTYIGCTPAAALKPPLKVGDRVRPLESYWCAHVRGKEIVIGVVSCARAHADRALYVVPFAFDFDREGVTWERLPC